MKFIKTGINKLYLFVIMLILCCTGVGSAAFIHVTITDESVTNSGGTPSHVAVASLYNGSKWTDYHSVEDALGAASSGNTVAIIPDSMAAIHGSVTIESGVTLAIPIVNKNLDTTSVNGNNNTAYHEHTDEKPAVSLTYTVVNTLTLKKNATLTLNGTAKLVVYGQLSGGNGGGAYCGQPFGNISELKMEAGSSIVCNGTSSITAYGIITDARTDKSTQTQGKITMNSGTDIKAPYIIRDFKGGTVSAGIYKETKGLSFSILINYKPDMPIYQAPFYQFQVLNIEPVLEVLYGGTLTGVVNINAGEQMNMKTMKVFGTDSNSFLEFTDEEHSKIVADYNEETEICDMTIYGGAKMNGMAIDINIPIYGKMSFNTADYVYPLTWRHKITLSKDKSQTEANFTVPQDFKCLPGAYFKVGPGCKIDFQGMLTVLNYGAAGTANCFNDINYQGELYKYCKSSTYSQSVVNPTFINYGHVSMGTGGGLIQAGAAGATLIATGSNSAVSYEATAYSGSSFYCVVDSYETKTNVLRGKVEGVSGETTLEVGKEYISNSDKEWSFNEKLILSSTNISFNTTEIAELTLTVYGLEGYSPTIDTGNNNLSYTLSEPIEDTTLRTRTYTITLSATSDLTTTLTVTCGGKTATCQVNANQTTISVTGVSLDITSKTLDIGDTQQLTATVAPENATNKTVTWSSGSDAIATVSETGLVTAVSAGKTTITVTTQDGSKTATCDITVNEESSGGGTCLVEGTLITMADGTKVPVEDIDPGDMVMAFDHEQGKFVSAPVMLNAHKGEGYKTLTVTELVFDDGTNLKIAHNHALFSLTHMNYVTLDRNNAHEFIGDTFYSYGDKEIKLVSTRNYTDTVRVYVPFTQNHINCVANGLLTNPGVYANFLTSIFTYKDNMQIDSDIRNKDIEQYGLFTYEDLSMYISETMFNELNLQYLKIGIGKGMYTMDDVIKYLGLYKKYFKQ